MNFIYNDGGRKQTGYKGKAGDCACRAIAIATGRAYQQVYDKINLLAKSERRSKRKRKKSSARNGVYVRTVHKFMESIGWQWTPTMFVGAGCKVHLTTKELPEQGSYVLRLSRHYVAWIDGVLHDTHDCSRNGTRCVYGYWSNSKGKENESEKESCSGS